jgi:hypothetical protein
MQVAMVEVGESRRQWQERVGGNGGSRRE